MVIDGKTFVEKLGDVFLRQQKRRREEEIGDRYARGKCSRRGVEEEKEREVKGRS